MSRQSLAVNSSGALTGTSPWATWSPSTVMVMVSGPAGRGSAYSVVTWICAGPVGSFWVGPDPGSHDDEGVVLVAQHAVVDVAGQAAAGAAERVEHAGRVVGDVEVDGDHVGAVAQSRVRRTRASG